jgi:hypothetical protein
LCDGAIASAERVRHLAWVSAEQAPWSPHMTVTSLRQVAEASTVTSHNCALALKALAARTEHTGFAEISTGLLAAADNAGRTRDHWLRVARAVGQITTDTRGRTSQAANEASDLALWTGRLAYADPQWTPANGPAHEARSPASLVPGPADVPPVVAAVHHAFETLTQLSYAEGEQISSAARAGRILVPTRSLPAEADIPRPYARAPRERVDLLLSQYRNAGQVSRQTAAAVGDVATATHAPSQVLNTARAAVQAGRLGRPDKRPVPDTGPDTWRDHPAIGRAGQEEPKVPGQVESSLLDIGITRPELLQRGADIDTALQRLNNDVAAELHPSRPGADAAMPDRAATAALIHQASPTGAPETTAPRKRPAEPEREAPEPEP